MADVQYTGVRKKVANKTGDYTVVFRNGAVVTLQDVVLDSDVTTNRFKVITDSAVAPMRTDPVSFAVDQSQIVAIFRTREQA